MDFGTGTIHFGSLSGSGQVSGNSGGTHTLVVGEKSSSTFGGTIIDQTGTMALTKDGAATTLILSGTGNTYTGDTTVQGGTLQLGTAGTLYTYNNGNLFINGASTLRVSGNSYQFNGKTFTFDSTGGGTLDTVATGAGGFVFAGTNTFKTSGGARNTMSSSGQDYNRNGNTANFDVAVGSTPSVSNLKVTGVLWNSGNITKTGSGTMELTGANTYGGTTTVNQGTLWLHGATHTGTGAYTIANGGTLKGAANIRTHALTVNNGATVSPGNSPGILSTGTQTWNNGSIYTWETDGHSTTAQAGYDPIIGTAGTDWDQQQVTGLLDFSLVTSTMTLQIAPYNLANSTLFQTDLFPIWTYTSLAGWDVAALAHSGKFTFVGLGGINVANAYIYADNLSGAGSIWLGGIEYTIPEPSIAMLLGLGGADAVETATQSVAAPFRVRRGNTQAKACGYMPAELILEAMK